MSIYEEERFEYNGYECRVLFMDRGFRCGYIKIPESHPLCVDDYDYINNFVNCHGGLTYARYYLNGEKCNDGVWVGFDCGHCVDALDIEALRKYYPDAYSEKWLKSHSKVCAHQSIKTLDFCKDQLKNLADQLNAIKEEASVNIKKSFDNIEV